MLTKFCWMGLSHLFFLSLCYAQKGNPIPPVQSFKFGQISRAEMAMTKYADDPDAHALILFDIGENTLYVAQDLSTLYKVHRRIKILTEAGATKWSNIFINYGGGNSKPKIKASVFSMNADSSIVEMHLDSKDIFAEKVLKKAGFMRIRATLPKVNVGSIVEYEYTIANNDGLSLRGWTFQYDEPVLFSRFTFRPPALVFFKHLVLGDLAPRVSQEDGYTTYTLRNIPALREQSFTSNIDNYRSALKFRLTQAGDTKIYSNWSTLFAELLQFSDFNYHSGGSVYKDIDKPLLVTTKNKKETIKALYEHTTNTMSWDSTFSIIPAPNPRKLIEKKTGNSAALNMYLLNLLKEADIKTEMVMVSTRSNGIVGTTEPFPGQYNHIMLRAFLTDTTYMLLDCTDKTLPYNLLNDECLFISGFVVKTGQPELVTSYPSAGESELALMNLKVDENGKLQGELTLKYKDYSASQKRNQLAGKDPSDWVKRTYFKDQNGAEVSIENVEGASDRNADLVVKAMIGNSEYVQIVNDELYMNPLLVGRITETPFKMEQRSYPVDVLTSIDRNFVLNLMLPDGWIVSEHMKSIGVALPGKKAYFMRTVDVRDNQLSVRFRLQISAGSYPLTDYTAFRDFYDRLVKAMTEQIVLKKKS